MALDEISPSPENNELYRPVDPSDPDVIALADSIAEYGIREPLAVTLDGWLVSGHRRHVAADIAGLTEVPVTIVPIERSRDIDGFTVLLREYNRQRLKTLDEKLREELVSTDPDEAYQTLVDHRKRSSLDAPVELASLQDGMGVCLSKMKRFDEAEQALTSAMDSYRAIGHTEGQAAVQGNLGVMRFRQGELEEARKHFNVALRLNQAVGNVVVSAICRSNIGDVLSDLGKLEEARQEFEGALAVFRRTRSQDHRYEALVGLLGTLQKPEDRELERQRVNELIEVSEELGRPALRRKALALACRLAVQGGDHDELVEHLKAWNGLSEAAADEQDQQELRSTVGTVSTQVMNALPGDLRHLLV